MFKGNDFMGEIDGGTITTLAASFGAMVVAVTTWIRTRTTAEQKDEADARMREIARQENSPIREYMAEQKVRDQWMQENVNSIRTDIRDMLPELVRESVRSTADAMRGRKSD